MASRYSGLDVAVFNLSGDYLIDLESATLSVEVTEADAKGIADQFSYAWATGRSWSLEAEVFVGASGAALVALAGGGDAIVAVSFDTGGQTYAGSGLITSAGHTVNNGLQSQKVTIKGQGSLTIS